MTVGVKDQASAEPETKASSDKELNFRKLEEARQKDREDKIRLEMQNQQLEKELNEIKEYLKPKEADPFDDIDEYVDPELKTRLVKKFDSLSSSFERKAEEAAERKYQQIQRDKEEAKKKNFLQNLQGEFGDYDQVMSEQNLVELGNKDPVFLQTAMKVPDEYEKRKYIYQKIKGIQSAEPTKTVQDKVQENMRNPYFFPSSATPTSSAIDYDLNAPGARTEAYKKLKAAQRGKR